MREGDSGEIVDNLHADLEVIKSWGIVNTRRKSGKGLNCMECILKFKGVYSNFYQEVKFIDKYP